MKMLKGNLTYLMAGIAFFWGAAGMVLNYLAPETAFIDTAEATKAIWGGLAVFGLRRSVGN